MGNVYLRPMTATEFDKFADWSVSDYAESLVKSGKETEATAWNAAWKEFQEAFPAGVDSESLCCCVIENECREAIGVITYEVGDKQGRRAFLSEFVIAPPQRGMRYGRAALSAVLKDARARGFETMGLNVFHHNEAALHLYTSCGFQVVRVCDGNSIMERKTE